ncbi:MULTISPECIES: cupredoxin domain-containing protein [Paraburkholderia]|uniref:Cupredoxin family copper-binding protein n=1 Tax=Paraburkholderia unamae TaxID=219649 RepID=A0ACC6RDR0_9BURK
MSRLRRVALGVCAIVCAAGAGPAAAARYVVAIEQMRFDPPSVTVHAGDSVVWVNKDLVAHTVTAEAKTFDSGSIAPGASWRYVASKRGRHAYSCQFHPVMHGTLIVVPGP